MDQRRFEIELSKLVMRCFAEGLRQDDLIKALQSKLAEEERIREFRHACQRTY